MTDNPNFVFRWVIDNSTERFATGMVESGEFNEGGLRWTAALEQVGSWANFSLRCGVDHNRSWKCEVKLEVDMVHSRGFYIPWIQKNRLIFNENSCTWRVDPGQPWHELNHPSYKISDKVAYEFRINIISSERGDPIPEPSKFAAPNNKSNVILKIGYEKIHVSKELLALHSPVFDTLFFGNFVEKGKEEVELKDVMHKEFLDLMYVIYPGTVDITDLTVQHILKLADQFQMERVLNQSEKYLIQSKGFNVMKKIMLAGQYRLVSLRDHCLQSFTSALDIVKNLKSSPECPNFSGDMKAAICDKIVELKLQ